MANVYFQQDGAAVHTAGNWCRSKDVPRKSHFTLWRHPKAPRSPDLSTCMCFFMGAPVRTSLHAPTLVTGRADGDNYNTDINRQ